MEFENNFFYPDKIDIPVVTIDQDLVELFPLFVKSRREDVIKIAKSIEEENFTELGKIGHDLRGAPGAFGYDFLVSLGWQIEAAAKLHDLDKLHEYLQQYLFLMENHEITFEGDSRTYHLRDFD